MNFWCINYTHIVCINLFSKKPKRIFQSSDIDYAIPKLAEEEEELTQQSKQPLQQER